jgi:hypothetical protein
MYDPLVVDTFIGKYQQMAANSEMLRADAPTPELLAIAESGVHRKDGRSAQSESDRLRRMRGLSIEHLATAALDDLHDCTLVLFQRSETDDALNATSAVGVAAKFFRGTSATLTERVVGWVAANGTSIFNADARLDGPAVRSLGTCTAVPIVEHATVIGVVAVYTYGDRVLTTDERTRLELLAGAVGTTDLA